MSYEIFLEEHAIADIHQAIDFYDSQQIGLGKKFEAEVDKHISYLHKNPFFQIRYSNVRCLPLRKFPFLIHYTVDEKNKMVSVISILNTSQDPKKWL